MNREENVLLNTVNNYIGALENQIDDVKEELREQTELYLNQQGSALLAENLRKTADRLEYLEAQVELLIIIVGDYKRKAEVTGIVDNIVDNHE